MVNAAFQLAEVLESYAVTGTKSPEAARGFEGVEDLAAWRRHHRAAELVHTVDFTLQGMDALGEQVDMFLTTLPKWYAAVHFASISWGDAKQINGVRPVSHPSELNLLRALGLVIDGGRPVTLGEDDRRALLDSLKQARQLVDEDTSMPDDVRRYVAGLITRAHVVVSNLGLYGHEAVRQVALELGGAMTAQADLLEESDPPKSGMWRAAARFLLGGFFTGAAGTAGSLTYTEGLKQLGGG